MEIEGGASSSSSSFLAPTYYPPPSCGAGECGSGEEEGELSVLPRHTKVVVRGNNRTKSVLVGLRGVVKKAVGLGGWHWLVLTNGVEVKLQRNALTVVEPPTGQEVDDDIEQLPLSITAAVDQPPPPPPPQQQMETDDDAQDAQQAAAQQAQAQAAVDLSKLATRALKKYRKHFKLCDVGPNSSKQQLLHSIGKHFVSHKLDDELGVIMGFLRAVKRLKK